MPNHFSHLPTAPLGTGLLEARLVAVPWHGRKTGAQMLRLSDPLSCLISICTISLYVMCGHTCLYNNI